eukprot:m51a1_g1539 hypothetical protein (275) ;mRNA; f:540694-541817
MHRGGPARRGRNVYIRVREQGLLYAHSDELATIIARNGARVDSLRFAPYRAYGFAIAHTAEDSERIIAALQGLPFYGEPIQCMYSENQHSPAEDIPAADQPRQHEQKQVEVEVEVPGRQQEGQEEQQVPEPCVCEATALGPDRDVVWHGRLSKGGSECDVEVVGPCPRWAVPADDGARLEVRSKVSEASLADFARLESSRVVACARIELEVGRSSPASRKNYDDLYAFLTSSRAAGVVDIPGERDLKVYVVAAGAPINGVGLAERNCLLYLLVL